VSAVLYIAADKANLLELGSQDHGGTAAWPHSAEAALPGRSLAAQEGGHGSGGGGGGESSEEGEDHHEEGHGHPHEAIFFLVGAIMIGTALLHLTFLKAFKGLQQTVVLFLLGCACSWLLEGTGLRGKLGAVGRSYGQWLAIDPHLLLFTLLPPLLAGDAMSIDTHLAQRVAKQCLYLAGPGVAINAALTAVFLWAYLPYDWPFLLCLTTGAILCATDPVAVVALLKELGASPTLTVQIQGESLLNDGTAIVLYMVTYNMLMGVEYSLGDVVVFLVKTALYAWLLGGLIGFGFFAWIRAAKNKLDHNSGLIQVALTIACAYTSFAVAEGLFHISGVLSTVAASLVLAHKMWPEVVSHETMKTVWHMLEYLGNTLIFFLAGALTGNTMVRIPFTDYLHLISIYLMLLFIRAALVMLSRPILQFLHPGRQPVSWPDAMVISWGGLRGAVGLALAIQVSISRAGGTISQIDADRVLFYVGGIALLTLSINATTCPALVRVLGVAQTPEVKIKLMQMLHSRLFKELSEKDCTEDVRQAVETMLEDLQHHIGGECEVGRERSDGSSVERAPTMQQRTTLLMRKVGLLASGDDDVLNKGELTCSLTRAADRYELVPEEHREVLQRHLPANPLLDKSSEILQQVIQAPPADPQLLRAINEAFLSLVRAHYWKQIEEGVLRPEDALPLIMSVTNALSGPCYQLSDLDWICPNIEWPEDDEAEVGRIAASPRIQWQLSEAASQVYISEESSGTHSILESSTFNAVIVVAIIANALVIFSGHGGSFALELISTLFFLAELLLRLVACGGLCSFFRNGWNVLDSAFVFVAVGGLAVRIAGAPTAELHANYPRDEVQVARSLVVLHKLPAVNLGRICRAVRSSWAAFCGTSHRVERAMHITKLEILFHFIRAHTAAQQKLVRFFGLRSRGIGAAEVKQCILMSQISVYHAKTVCAYEEEHLKSWMLDEKQVCQDSVKVTTELEHFVESARGGGVLSSSEAELLIHTMSDYVRSFERRISKMRKGRMTCGPQYISSSRSNSADNSRSNSAIGEVNTAAAADDDALSAVGLGLPTRAVEEVIIAEDRGADGSDGESKGEDEEEDENEEEEEDDEDDEAEDVDGASNADVQEIAADAVSTIEFGSPIRRTKNTQQLAEEVAEKLEKEQGAREGMEEGSVPEESSIQQEGKSAGLGPRLVNIQGDKDGLSGSGSSSPDSTMTDSEEEDKGAKVEENAEARLAQPQTIAMSDGEEQGWQSGGQPMSSPVLNRAPMSPGSKSQGLLDRAKKAVRLANYVELDEDGSPSGTVQDKSADNHAAGLKPTVVAAAGGGMSTQRSAHKAESTVLVPAEAAASVVTTSIADHSGAPPGAAATATSVAAPNEAKRSSRGSKGKAAGKLAAASQDKASEPAKKALRPLSEKDPGIAKLQKKPSDPSKAVRFTSQSSNAGKEDHKGRQGRSSGSSGGSGRSRRRSTSRQSGDPGDARLAEPLSDHDNAREMKQFTLDGQQADQVNCIKWKFDSAGAVVKSINSNLAGCQSLCPGDRLIAINETDVRRMTRPAIEEIWAKAQQEHRHLTLALLAPPSGAPASVDPSA